MPSAFTFPQPTATPYDYLAGLTASEMSVTTTATLTISKQHACSGTSADYTVTLPSASGNTGKFLSVRMAPTLTKLVTVDAGSGVTIDGVRTRVMWAGETAALYCDGTNWFKTAGRTLPMYCKLRKVSGGAAAQSIPANTMTIIQHDQTDDPTSRMADLTNYRVYARRPATYMVTQAVVWATGFTATRVLTRAILNAGNDYGGEIAINNSGNYGSVNWVLNLALAAGDYLTHNAYQTSGGSQNIYGTDLTGMSVLELPVW